MKISHIEKALLYNEGAAEKLNIESIAEYLRGKLSKVPVEIREPFPLFSPEERLDYAKKLASIKILDTNRRMTSREEPLYGEIQYEQRRILGKTRAFGVIYDGYHLQRSFSELIARGERTLLFVHIFFTNRLFATWGEGDRRYHARTSVLLTAKTSKAALLNTNLVISPPYQKREPSWSIL
ncbi:DUF6775 family putative metallopeptidase [Chloroflexota bacterium]